MLKSLRQTAFVGAFVLTAGTGAYAQVSDLLKNVYRGLEGTISTSPISESREGTVDACGFEFKSVAFDHAYRKGDPLIVDGSFTFRKLPDKNFAFFFKVGTLNVQNDGSFVRSRPFTSWFRMGATLVSPIASSDSEIEGYKIYLSAVGVDAPKVIEEIIKQGRVTVGFNRVQGGLDVVVPIDLSVRDTQSGTSEPIRKRDARLGREFADCVSQLL